MSEKKIVLTYEGLKKLENELEYLKVQKRQEIVDKIKEARAQGDLSENAEYDAAKDEQGEVETRIVEIEKLLRNAEVIDEEEIDLNVVNIGCKVVLKDISTKEEMDYSIVGSTEADPMENKISNESPIGAALLYHKEGDKVEVEVPSGKVKLQIIKIHR